MPQKKVGFSRFFWWYHTVRTSFFTITSCNATNPHPCIKAFILLLMSNVSILIQKQDDSKRFSFHVTRQLILLSESSHRCSWHKCFTWAFEVTLYESVTQMLWYIIAWLPFKSSITTDESINDLVFGGITVITWILPYFFFNGLGKISWVK